MLPALTGDGQDQRRHEYLYWEFNEKGGQQAVRTGEWKGVRINTKARPAGPVEVYDLSTDIGESKNLAPVRPELMDRIAEIMKKAHSEPASTQILIKGK